MLLQSAGQRQSADAVVRGSVANHGAADALQAKGLGAVDGVRQQRLEEHARVGVLVVLQQAGDGGSVEHTRVVHVEAKVMIPLLDARMQRASVPPEADREEVVFLRRVA